MNLDAQIAAVKQEIQRKEYSLPRLVKSGKLSEEKAFHQMMAFKVIYQTLTQLRGIAR